ncbi:MAG: aspartate-semialdehyde dehydrogenase [Holosporaceae bacterium]|jgi:aspartate-semialdehyde dehydrogenase|nr:aspartate-semialdehyde dehydrogenase [Holosporaceae bacterium]
MKNEYSVAVVGATGNAGMKTLQILEERNFSINNVVAIASEKSVGKEISFRDRSIKIKAMSQIDFSEVDIAIFCAGSSVSCKNADTVTAAGCVIIDKSSYFRLNPKVPLVIPEVNIDSLTAGAPLGIVSTPNCVTVPLVMTLKALSSLSSIKRVVISTYQSVSGAGLKAIDELYVQSKAIVSAGTFKSEIFQKQIAFNVIPAIGNLYKSGISEEEDKISCEVRKIMKTNVKVAVTCVRVPVFIGHSISVACEFEENVDDEMIYDAFENVEGIIVIDRKDESHERGAAFATPIDVHGEDAIFVSRVRRDDTVESGLLYWITSDNLRKGAALNSVQIAEAMISIDPQLEKFRKNAYSS